MWILFGIVTTSDLSCFLQVTIKPQIFSQYFSDEQIPETLILITGIKGSKLRGSNNRKYCCNYNLSQRYSIKSTYSVDTTYIVD